MLALSRLSPALALLPLLAACGFDARDAELTDGRVTVAGLPTGTLTATGTGTRGHHYHYERADYSCGEAGSSRTSSCTFGFSLAETADGGVTLAVSSYSPWSYAGEDALLRTLYAATIPVGMDGAAERTTLTNGAYTWIVDAELDEDGLHVSMAGVADNLYRCSGDRYTLSCDATYTDAALAAYAAPTRSLTELAAGDLVVTELVADPTACSDSHAEWIEVKNESGTRVDLAGLTLVDAGGASSTVTGSLVLADGAYAVIARGSTADFCDAAVHLDLGTTGTISLNNGGDSVTLSAGATTLDSVSYPAMAAGAAWSRDDGGAWCASDATPGEANDACPDSGSSGSGSSGSGSAGSGSSGGVEAVTLSVGELHVGDVVLSEIMFDPAAVSDSAGEWFEVTNTTSYSVDLAGLQVRDLANTTGTLGDHVVVAAGGSAWFGRGTSGSWGYGVAPSAYYGSTPALNNSGEQLWLVANGLDIDVTPTLNATAGASSQRDPSTGAWCVSTATWTGGDRATPGATNGSCP